MTDEHDPPVGENEDLTPPEDEPSPDLSEPASPIEGIEMVETGPSAGAFFEEVADGEPAEEMADDWEGLDSEEAYSAVSAFDAEAALGQVDQIEEPLPPDPPHSFSAVAALDSDERVRPPRAQRFRRRLREQISMLPLALLMIGLGSYLIAREQDLNDLPDLSTLALGQIVVLVVAFTAIWHAVLSGRRERGLLFLGLWVWTTAAMVAIVVYGIDEQPDAAEWWPLLLWSLCLTLVITYLIERTHDVRLLLLSIFSLVAGVVAYLITSGRADDQQLDRVADYWPLLISAMGIVLLPLAFRRKAGS